MKIALLLLTTALLLIASLVTVPEAQQPPLQIKTGVIVPLSGEFTRYGDRIRKGITKASPDHLKLIFDDEGCDAARAITSYHKLTSMDGVRYFLGPWCGSPQTAVAPMLRSGKQLAMLGSSAPLAVHELSGGRMFSTQHSIEQESTYLAQAMNSMGIRQTAIIFLENQFSRAHEKAFRTAFKGEVHKTFAYSTADMATIKAIVLQVRKMNLDALYLPDAFPLMQGFVKEIRSQGMQSLRIFSVYSAQSEDVLNALGKDGEGLIYSYPDIGDSNALEHFPLMAADILDKVISTCGENVDCSLAELRNNYKFDSNGVLEGALVLKTIRNGRFEKL